MTAMYRRHIASALREAMQDTPVVLLNGPRQTGKSTLAQAYAAEHGLRYLTLDDAATRAAATGDAGGFVAGLGTAVVLDEVQRAPDIFLPIKATVDQSRVPGQFLLTGSANVMLLPRIADSLAGRIEVVSLWPLSSAEQADAPELNRADWLVDGHLEAGRSLDCARADLVGQLLRGGFPEAASRAAGRRREAWFDNYLDAVLTRDVRELAQIEQIHELPQLAKLLAARSGSLLNMAELSRSSGLQQTTLKRYFALLETLFLVYRLLPWERNASKRLVKSPKVFLTDAGLLAHLSGATEAALMSAPGLPGALVESFVLNELLRHLAFSSKGLSLWHYRTQQGHEVDFVLEDRAGGLTGVEVKAGATLGESAFKGLKHLKETEPGLFRRGIVLYGGTQVVPFAPDLWALPLSMWWA
jgi:predicted AAA+ superfamily ATPase